MTGQFGEPANWRWHLDEVIAKLQWHDLRRSCGCRLLQDHGLDINRVKEWLGHASVVQTERAYAFPRTEELHAAIDAGTKTATGHADS